MALLRDVDVFQTAAAWVAKRQQGILLGEQAEVDYLFCLLMFSRMVIAYTPMADFGRECGCTSRSDRALWCGCDIFSLMRRQTE